MAAPLLVYPKWRKNYFKIGYFITKQLLSTFEKMKKSPLEFKVVAECGASKARTAIMSLPHHDVETPVFMPVGTQGKYSTIAPI